MEQLVSPVDNLIDQSRIRRWYETTGRPFVTLSWAQTLDGSLTLTQGESAPISCPQSMSITHQLRSEHDAILVGIGTVLADDPRLTARIEPPCSQPRPIVLDSKLRIRLNQQLFNHPQKPIIATTKYTNDSKLFNGLASVVKLPATAEGKVALGPLLDYLGDQGITSVMVEGGGCILTSFLKAGCINQAIITIAPVFAGGYDAVQPLHKDNWSQLPRLENMQTFFAGSDLIVSGDILTLLDAN